MKTKGFVLLLVLALALGSGVGYGASALTGKSGGGTATPSNQASLAGQTAAARSQGTGQTTTNRQGATQTTAGQQGAGQASTAQQGQGTAGGAFAAGGTIGTVQKTEGNVVTLAAQGGSTVKVTLSDKTTIQKTGQGSLADIVAEVSLTVVGQQGDGAINATTISITAQTAGGAFGKGGVGGTAGVAVTAGTVQKVEGNVVTLTARDGSTARVNVSSGTSIQKQVQGSLADLAAGTSLLVIGEKQGDGSILATTITLVANLPGSRSQ